MRCEKKVRFTPRNVFNNWILSDVVLILNPEKQRSFYKRLEFLILNYKDKTTYNTDFIFQSWYNWSNSML